MGSENTITPNLSRGMVLGVVVLLMAIKLSTTILTADTERSHCI